MTSPRHIAHSTIRAHLGVEDGVQDVPRVADRALRNAAGRMHGVQAEAQVVDVVQGVEDLQDKGSSSAPAQLRRIG